MPTKGTKHPEYIGVDVAKKRYDVATDTGETHTFRGVEKTLDYLESVGPLLVCCEASGGWERELVEGCWDRGVTIAKINPHTIKNFRIGLGFRAKTDKIDARVLAKFAEVVEPKPIRPLTAEQRDLLHVLARHGQIEKMIRQEGNRRMRARGWQVESIDEVLGIFEKHLVEVNQQMAAHLDSLGWTPKVELLKTVPGIAQAAAVRLLCGVPELGELSRRQIAALVGVNPWTNESGGSQVGPERSRGGRADARKLLWVCSMSLLRRGGVLDEHYARLRARGKPARVARLAICRRLLCWCNAVVRDGKEWDISLVKPRP